MAPELGGGHKNQGHSFFVWLSCDLFFSIQTYIASKYWVSTSIALILQPELENYVQLGFISILVNWMEMSTYQRKSGSLLFYVSKQKFYSCGHSNGVSLTDFNYFNENFH